jgi:hypothetical protein
LHHDQDDEQRPETDPPECHFQRVEERNPAEAHQEIQSEQDQQLKRDTGYRREKQPERDLSQDLGHEKGQRQRQDRQRGPDRPGSPPAVPPQRTEKPAAAGYLIGVRSVQAEIAHLQADPGERSQGRQDPAASRPQAPRREHGGSDPGCHQRHPRGEGGGHVPGEPQISLRPATQ